MDKKKLEAFKKRLETRQQEFAPHRESYPGRRPLCRRGYCPRIFADRGRQFLHQGIPVQSEQQRRQPCRWSIKLLFAFAKATLANASTAGKEINAKRLEAVPWTRHCIECQEKQEQDLLEEAPR